MKFRARLGEAVQLSKLTQTLDKVGDQCVVQLSTEAISFAVVGESSDGVQVYADIARSSLFLDYRIESKAQDQIAFTAKVANLCRALKSSCAQANVQTVVKLTKKTGIPSFSFEIEQPQTQLKITHDVPIRLILDDEELERYREPAISVDALAGSASVVLPAAELKGLRNVIERMRSFSAYVVLSIASGPKGGTLRLHMQRENLMSISTTYSGLDRVAQEGIPPTSTAEAKVEIKKLSRVLQALLSSDIKMSQVIVCVIPDETVIIKCFLFDPEKQNSIVCYLPISYLDTA